MIDTEFIEETRPKVLDGKFKVTAPPGTLVMIMSIGMDIAAPALVQGGETVECTLRAHRGRSPKVKIGWYGPARQ